MHFLSARGIPPAAVGDGELNVYREVTFAEGLVRSPRDDVRAVCVAWNHLRSRGTALNVNRLEIPDSGDIYALEAEAYPFSFRMELESYLAFLARDVMTSGRTPLRPGSLRSIRQIIFAYVSALVHSGLLSQDVTSLAVISDPVLVRLALTFLAKRSGKSRNKQMTHITSAVASMARNWVRVSPEAQTQLDELRSGFAWSHAGVALKNRILLAQFDSHASTRALLSLPRKLVNLAEQTQSLKRGARMFMMALAIEMLLIAPLRPSEMLEINVDRDILDGLDGTFIVVITQHRYMSTRERRIPLGAACSLLLDTYLRHHRPLLLEAPSSALFPGACGGSLGAGAFATAVRKWSLRLAGVEMTPTAYRHFAAKHYLDCNPGGFAVLRGVFGHVSAATTLKTYSQMDTPTAARAVDARLFPLIISGTPARGQPPLAPRSKSAIGRPNSTARRRRIA